MGRASLLPPRLLEGLELMTYFPTASLGYSGNVLGLENVLVRTSVFAVF